MDADDDTSQDAADLVSQESKESKSKSSKSENIVKKQPAPVDAFVHVIGHPDKQDSPKRASLKENLVIVDKPLEPSHSEVGIS